MKNQRTYGNWVSIKYKTGEKILVMLNISGAYNATVERVPGGVVHIGGLASEGVLVIWYCRYTL